MPEENTLSEGMPKKYKSNTQKYQNDILKENARNTWHYHQFYKYK